ncbi:MAG: CBS domain-containing protein [Thermodesulfobacteriota bacterium]
MQVITTHLNADFDALASMIAAKKLYPEAVLAFSGSQEKGLRLFFVQSLQYMYDFARLKKIALEEVDHLIVVDTRQPKRIGNFAKCLANPGLRLHLYDHHPDAPDDMHGELEVVRPVGSTATILTGLLRERGLALTAQEATLLALGIYEDTGSFTFASTSPEDLMAASHLLAAGANVHTIAHFITHELTTEQVGLLSELIRSARTYAVQGTDITVARLSLAEYVDDFALIVRRFMEMENLNVLFALAYMGDRVYLIARSRLPEVNVGDIATAFGGGGHASAASATIRDATLIEAEERLLQLLHEQVQPRSVAAEIMSRPVISVEPELSMEAANQVLTRYNITVLPVMKDHQTLQGLISRRVIEKAIFHKLGALPVSEYMTTEFATLPPTASLAAIQELIMGNRQRFIPVVEGDQVKGVITRTDLLNLVVNEPALLTRKIPLAEEAPATERFRNVNQLLVECLDRETTVLLRTIGEVAARLGYSAFAVGGFVRDLLLHHRNLDLDIVVEGDGIAFAKELARLFHARLRTHEKFNTAMVILPGGLQIDVATARVEYYEYPAALPTVELSSIKLDLYRRDFTINAMAIHLNPDRFATLVDFFACQRDIKEGQIRVLHNLSFVEDPTRVFRAVRFEQRLGFRIGPHTAKLIKNAVRMSFFNRFSGRRFFGELCLILGEEDPLAAIQRLADFDCLRFLHRDLRLTPRLERQLADTHRVLGWHRLLYLDEPCQHWMVYLLVLLAPQPVSECQDFCHRFEVPSRLAAIFLQNKVFGDKVHKSLSRRASIRPSEIYRLLGGLSIEGILATMALTPRESAQKAISSYVTSLRSTRTILDGTDLKALGYQPGPVFKSILAQLLEARLDGEVASRDDEEAYVLAHFPQPAGRSRRGGAAASRPAAGS